MRFQCGGFEVEKVQVGGCPSSCVDVLVIKPLGEKRILVNTPKGRIFLHEDTVYRVYKSTVYSLPVGGTWTKDLEDKYPIGAKVKSKLRANSPFVGVIVAYEGAELVCRPLHSDERVRYTYRPTDLEIITDTYLLMLEEAYENARQRQLYSKEPSGHMRGLKEAIDLYEDFRRGGL